MVFHAERAIEKGSEVMNCYGLQGNTQWLMNGGFLDRSRPCDDLLVTPADVVSAVLEDLQESEEADEVGFPSIFHQVSINFDAFLMDFRC